MSKRTLGILIIIGVLVADQVFKIWIKNPHEHGPDLSCLSNWFLIRFIENPGMAFGIESAR